MRVHVLDGRSRPSASVSSVLGGHQDAGRLAYAASIARYLAALGRAALSVLFLSWFGPSVSAQSVSKPRIDVPGVIQFTRIVQPDEYDLVDGQLEQEISPDEQHFFLITRRQNLSLNKVEYKLLLFDAAALSHPAGEERRPLPGRVLVQVQSSEDHVFEYAIGSARWLDNVTILFLAEFDDRPAQLYSINIRTGKLEQLTQHESAVLAYVYEPSARVAVYVARVPVDNRYMKAASFVAGNTSLTRILYPDELPKQLLIYRYYRVSVDEPTSAIPLGEPFKMGRVPPLMSISPNGRWVITRSTFRELAESTRLANAYAPLRSVMSSYLAQDEDPDSLFTEDYSLFLMRFRIFDVRTGAELPWFDVPDATSIGKEWPFAYWTSHGDSVVIANTYLPLTNVDEGERIRREAAPAVIEYWPGTGRFKKIADLLPDRLAFEGLYPITAMENAFLLKQKGLVAAYRRRGETWRPDTTLVTKARRISRIRGHLRVRQSLNESPDIFYSDGAAAEVRVTDLNPQLRDLDLGRITPYHWHDKDGREWEGGLLLPSDLDPKRRYPLVIQLYGFSEDKFYIDGARSIASAMAGRAYLREGILVLALTTKYLQYNDRRDELFVHAEGVRAAIDRLSADGFIDPDRVGIVGFSATGNLAQHIITFSDVRIRAATLADFASTSLFGDVAYYYGFFKPGMLFAERRLGATPWGKSAEDWAKRDPSLHTDCIEAAVRFEFYNLYAYPGWDSYALLRRQYKPVEAVVFPKGDHQLRRPQERFDSLQGNVDWFGFWLADEEDSDPSKAEQYDRWRAMKARIKPAPRNPACILER